MKISEQFQNVFSYARGIETWCKGLYLELSGYELQYTFTSDLALVDWRGDVKEVEKSYKNILKQWSSDYKAFTELCIAINLLAWANEKLEQQGIDGRSKFTQFYSELYYKAKNEFYEKFKGQTEILDYFFNMTD
jgi:hypothetical protein